MQTELTGISVVATGVPGELSELVTVAEWSAFANERPRRSSSNVRISSVSIHAADSGEHSR